MTPASLRRSRGPPHSQVGGVYPAFYFLNKKRCGIPSTLTW
jgi:hypothetical protein